VPHLAEATLPVQPPRRPATAQALPRRAPHPLPFSRLGKLLTPCTVCSNSKPPEPKPTALHTASHNHHLHSTIQPLSCSTANADRPSLGNRDASLDHRSSPQQIQVADEHFCLPSGDSGLPARDVNGLPLEVSRIVTCW
jgi:hypothetical protein